jgi:hypothetical protein
MTCADIEILLCDYVDGTIHAGEKTALESHIASCAACAELARDVTGAVEFIDRAAAVEPPAELLTRILHHLPSVKPAAEKRAWWRTAFGGWFQTILSPRPVMGMAMTILSFAMLAKFSPVKFGQLHPSDLDPVKIWASIDDRTHRAWDRSVKYYENLRLVIEIQSRLKEWKDQDQAPVAAQAPQGLDANGSGGQQPAAANANKEVKKK